MPNTAPFCISASRQALALGCTPLYTFIPAQRRCSRAPIYIRYIGITIYSYTHLLHKAAAAQPVLQCTGSRSDPSQHSSVVAGSRQRSGPSFRANGRLDYLFPNLFSPKKTQHWARRLLPSISEQ